MRSTHHRPGELLGHGPPAILLDEIVGWDEGTIEAALTVRADDRYVRDGLGMPAHLGIEWMAQAAGAYAGLEAQAVGQPARIGFLLGTRNYHAAQPWFPLGQRLLVSATLVFREQEMAVFDCRITSDDAIALASARLTVYQPVEAPQPQADPSHG